ncbi:MAG: T9SS type A sorting domain-containing protein [Flavobacteriaceae bacterium]
MKYKILFLIFFRLAVHAQDGSLDNSFLVGTGVDLDVFLIHQLSSEKILIGGQFTNYNGFVVNGLARLDLQGNLDNSFHSGIGGNYFKVYDLVEEENKLLIVGEFGLYDSVNRYGLARLNLDGTLDPTFDPGLGANRRVLRISKQADKYIITGSFSSYNGYPCGNIARINSDGSIDQSFFSQGTEVGLQRAIVDHIIQSDGRIMIVGEFFTYNGIPTQRIARLNADGTLDNTFNPGTGPNRVVRSITIQADGKYIIGGLFGNYNGFSAPLIARINSDGSFDSTFSPDSGYGIAASSLIVQPDQKILAAGVMTTLGGDGKFLHRLMPDGTIDSDFDSTQGFNNDINIMTMQHDGKILVGGLFDRFNDFGINRIARINNNLNLSTHFSKTEHDWYPNPIKDKLFYKLNSSEELVLVTGVDLSGKVLMLPLEYYSSGVVVDTSKLYPGAYLFNFQTSKGNTIIKVFKQ